jgi:hypothetical protein
MDKNGLPAKVVINSIIGVLAATVSEYSHCKKDVRLKDKKAISLTS